jgi:hypothetical protein
LLHLRVCEHPIEVVLQVLQVLLPLGGPDVQRPHAVVEQPPAVPAAEWKRAAAVEDETAAACRQVQVEIEQGVVDEPVEIHRAEFFRFRAVRHDAGLAARGERERQGHSPGRHVLHG